MGDWIRQLDRLLRGDLTRLEELQGGTINVRMSGLVAVAVMLGVIYGLCMGVFSLTGAGSHAPMQSFASAVKVPALFFCTLLVTFPSLYVFNALVGSSLRLVSVLRLLVATMAIMLAVLSSLGPIVAFFALTTTSYPFMKLLNVVAYSVAGFLGGGFLLRTLHRLTVVAAMAEERRGEMQRAATTSAPTPPPAAPPPPPMPANIVPPPIIGRSEEPLGGPPAYAQRPLAAPAPGANVRAIFRIWILVFGLVGAQMAWIMRPFIGDPNLPFQWFRPRQSNFFEAVVHAIEHLF